MIDDFNSLALSIKDVQALASNIFKIFENKELANRLSKKVKTTVKEYSWDTAVFVFASASE